VVFVGLLITLVLTSPKFVARLKQELRRIDK
jgi:hypothetical protein